MPGRPCTVSALDGLYLMPSCSRRSAKCATDKDGVPPPGSGTPASLSPKRITEHCSDVICHRPLDADGPPRVPFVRVRSLDGRSPIVRCDSPAVAEATHYSYGDDP